MNLEIVYYHYILMGYRSAVNPWLVEVIVIIVSVWKLQITYRKTQFGILPFMRDYNC